MRRIISKDGVFIMREHHCKSPDMGAFLDIIHGLYSLAWKDPVEDPRFLQDYKVGVICMYIYIHVCINMYMYMFIYEYLYIHINKYSYAGIFI
jgi:hypothetical protein